MSFLKILTIALVILKVLNYIDCSWWIVLSPLWIPLAAIVIICLIGLLIS